MYVLFLSTIALGVAYCATPGAVNAEALRQGMARGFWAALLVQLGSLIGDTLWAIVALSGTAYLVRNAPLQVVLGIAGGCFLLRLAYVSLKDAWRGVPIQEAAESMRGTFETGAFFSLTNPTALVFWVGIGGGIVSTASSHPRAGTFVTFMAGFELGAVCWCVCSAILIAWGRRHAGNRVLRWVNGVCGTLLGYFGLRVLWRGLSGLRLARLLIG